MILKPYQISSSNINKSNFFLLYGQNEGQKNEVIQKIFESGYTKNIFRYDEDEVFNIYKNFISEISNRSFFEEKKIIVISRVSEKILSLINDVREKKIEDIKIIINSKPLDRKSKLRSEFENEKDMICIPFYSDDHSTIANIANKFFIEKKIPISREMLNLLVERCRGDRINLKNEMTKIEAFIINKKKISADEILNITNLAENYSF